MAKSITKYSEDHVKLRLKTSDDPQVQKYLRDCLSKYKEPRADYMEPEVRGEDTITVMSNDLIIGDVYKKDESLYYNNFKNARRTYLDIDEDDETGQVYCTAVLVVKCMITDEDLKKARTTKNGFFVLFTLIFAAMAVISFVRGIVLDGVFFSILTPAIAYYGFVRLKDKYETFLPRYQRKQK